MTQTFNNYIGGQWVAASNGAITHDTNPANTREELGTFPSATRQDAQHAIDAAHGAFAGWAKTPMPKRGEILDQAANWMEARLDEIGAALTREEGKTFAEGKGEVARGVSILRYFAGQCMEPTGDVFPSASASTFLFAERVQRAQVLLPALPVSFGPAPATRPRAPHGLAT